MSDISGLGMSVAMPMSQGSPDTSLGLVSDVEHDAKKSMQRVESDQKFIQESAETAHRPGIMV